MYTLDWKLIAIGPCDGGVPPDTLGRLLDIGLAGFALGAIVSLIMSVVLLRGMRLYLSLAMLGILAVIFWVVFLVSFTSENTPLLAAESVILIGIVTFAGLGILSVVYWPTKERLVNLPLVLGAGVAWGAVILHEIVYNYCPLTGW